MAVSVADRSLRVARFRERPNRFLGLVELQGQPVECHISDSGRLRELLRPGAEVLIAKAASARRRTAYDLLAVRAKAVWVCVAPRLASRLVRQMLEQQRVPELAEYSRVEVEVPWGHSRLDFRLSREGETCWVELKSCTLVVDGEARFPDAPTVRGQRQMADLAALRRSGQRAVVFFLVQRPDAQRFAPHDEIDPAFGAALRAAAGDYLLDQGNKR